MTAITRGVRAYLALPKLHVGPVFTGADYVYLAVFAAALVALAAFGGRA